MVPIWFCEIDGQQHGPLTPPQLKELVQSGRLQPAHPVWREGMQNRVPARTVKGLFDAAPAGTVKTQVQPKQTQFVPNLEIGPPASKASQDGAVEMVEEVVEEVEEHLEEVVEPVVEEVVEHVEPVQEVVEEVTAVGDEDDGKRARKKGNRDRDGDGKEERPEKKPPAEILAEASVTYREGLPKVDGPLTAQLLVESTGLRFQFEDEADAEFFLAFEKVENVLEPAKGDFPPAMKKKALGAKIGGKAGQLASGLVGSWLGGDTGKAVSKVGSSASKMAEASGDLGKPPRNRLTVYARLRKDRCKILFDVNGADRAEMNEEAGLLFKKIQKARSKTTDEGEAANINIVVNQSGGGRGGVPGPAAPVKGKPFRVLNAGQLSGPFSVAEIRKLVNEGQLGADALIGVETWVPIATLSGLLTAGAGARAGKGGGGGAGAAGVAAAAAGEAGEHLDEGAEEENHEELEELAEEGEEQDFDVVDDDGDEDESPAASKEDDDEGSLSVGEEFQLD
jgi:hypothetical protein